MEKYISNKTLLVKDFYDLDFFHTVLKENKIIFENIKIVKLLGSGAEGKVYKSSEYNGKFYALKVFEISNDFEDILKFVDKILEEFKVI